jgi:hypothetical protein
MQRRYGRAPDCVSASRGRAFNEKGGFRIALKVFAREAFQPGWQWCHEALYPRLRSIRLSTEFRSAIDAWRNAQPIEPSRSAAIIYLASVGLRALASGFEPKQERKEK